MNQENTQNAAHETPSIDVVSEIKGMLAKEGMEQQDRDEHGAYAESIINDGIVDPDSILNFFRETNYSIDSLYNLKKISAFLKVITRIEGVDSEALSAVFEAFNNDLDTGDLKGDSMRKFAKNTLTAIDEGKFKLEDLLENQDDVQKISGVINSLAKGTAL